MGRALGVSYQTARICLLVLRDRCGCCTHRVRSFARCGDRQQLLDLVRSCRGAQRRARGGGRDGIVPWAWRCRRRLGQPFPVVDGGADGRQPRLGLLVVDRVATAADEGELASQFRRLGGRRVGVALVELGTGERGEHRLSAGRDVGRQGAPGPVADAEHAPALDGRDELHVDAGEDHEVDGLLDAVDERLHRDGAEVTQEGHGRIRRRRGRSARPGPYVRSLRWSRSRGRRASPGADGRSTGQRQPRRCVGEPQGSFGLEELGEPKRVVHRLQRVRRLVLHRGTVAH